MYIVKIWCLWAFSIQLDVDLTWLLTVSNRSKNELDKDEFMFFLTGGVGLENKLANPAPTWLTDKSWDELCRLSDLKKYKKFRCVNLTKFRYEKFLNYIKVRWLSLQFFNVHTFSFFSPFPLAFTCTICSRKFQILTGNNHYMYLKLLL